MMGGGSAERTMIDKHQGRRVLNRRGFISGMAAAAALLPADTFAQSISLADAARRGGVTFGASITADQIETDPDYIALVLSQCSVLVPSWDLKWRAVESRQGEFDFQGADLLVGLARLNGKQVRGHTLMWHRAIPQWVPQSRVVDLALEHIERTVTRYHGHITQWDVVNEPIHAASPVSGLRQSPFLAQAGPGYLDQAFRRAAAAGPDAVLFMNEFGLYYDEPEQELKRQATITLLRRLLDRGVPVHGLGVQGHLIAGKPFDPDRFTRFLETIAGMGLKTMITELDISEQMLKERDVGERDRILADHVGKFVAAAMAARGCEGVVTWGLSDRYSWIHDSADQARPDRLASRPLPFDANLRPKPMVDAISRAIAS
jgi:endo-1,4-beta-xylanase